MQLPDSKLGAMLRAKKAGTISGSFYDNLKQDPGFNSGLSLAPFQSVTDMYTDEFRQVRHSIIIAVRDVIFTLLFFFFVF